MKRIINRNMKKLAVICCMGVMWMTLNRGETVTAQFTAWAESVTEGNADSSAAHEALTGSEGGNENGSTKESERDYETAGDARTVGDGQSAGAPETVKGSDTTKDPEETTAATQKTDTRMTETQKTDIQKTDIQKTETQKTETQKTDIQDTDTSSQTETVTKAPVSPIRVYALNGIECEVRIENTFICEGLPVTVRIIPSAGHIVSRCAIEAVSPAKDDEADGVVVIPVILSLCLEA